MGMPARAIYDDAVSNPQAIGESVPTAVRVGWAVIEGGASAASAGMDTGLVAVIGGIAGDLGAWFVVGVLLNAVWGLVLMRWLEWSFAGVLSRVPWVGGKLASLIHLIFSPVHPLENWVFDQMHTASVAAIKGAIDLVRKIIDITFPHTSVGQTVATNQSLAPIYAQNAQQWASIHDLQHRVATLEHELNLTSGATSSNNLTVQQQIRAIQNALSLEWKNQQALYTDMQRVLHDLKVLNSELQQVKSTLYGVRTVQVGFQDLVDQVQKLEDALQSQVNRLSTQTTQNTEHLNTLSPLSMLLQPGIVGLQNLRTLEDNMCQCPGFSFQKPLDVEALGIYEFISYG